MNLQQLAGFQRGCATDQALLHYSAKNFLTVSHVLSITAFCISMYRPERKLNSLKLSCSFLEGYNTNGTI
jgi:hypothetical protein